MLMLNINQWRQFYRPVPFNEDVSEEELNCYLFQSLLDPEFARHFAHKWTVIRRGIRTLIVPGKFWIEEEIKSDVEVVGYVYTERPWHEEMEAVCVQRH